MSLLAYQTALGRVIRSPESRRRDDIAQMRDALNEHESLYLLRLLDGRGLPFTIDVQRSWCKGRARDAATMTLSLLPAEVQQQLLERWVERGGGTSSFFANEADGFLDFIATQLEPRTHAYSICRSEQAAHRAARGNAETAAPITKDTLSPESVLAISRYSSLVEFYCDPDQLFSTLSKHSPLPDIEKQITALLFAPWIPGYFRYAKEFEINLLAPLRQLTIVSELLFEGHDLQCLVDLVNAGVLIEIDSN
jgi:hypothetical protein